MGLGPVNMEAIWICIVRGFEMEMMCEIGKFA